MLLRGSKVASRVVTPLAQPTTFRAGCSMSPLLDFKRQKLRKQWVCYVFLVWKFLLNFFAFVLESAGCS